MADTFKWQARYSVLSVLFFTWIVSFMDRMAVSVAMPYIAADFHLSSLQSGLLLSAFFLSYSIAQIPGGYLADFFGVRKVATFAMLWWSVFTGLTGLAAGLVQMAAARFVFGLGEGTFPACAYKTISIWFPKKERATANAVMLASNPLGAALSPLLVVGIMSVWGWRAVFFVLFVPGILAAVLFWLFVPDDPAKSARVTPGELAHINQSELEQKLPVTDKVSFKEFIVQPNIVRYFLILFSFDIAYWGFTTWLPTYLVKARGFSMVQMGVAASLPFFAGTLGCVLGGWVSDRYFPKNRTFPILVMQVSSAVLLYLVLVAKSVVALMIFQTLAGFCLMFFITTFWALPMNTVSKRLMGVTSGFINMAGQLAAFVSPIVIGYLLGSEGGNFNMTFGLFIGSIIVSIGLLLTLKPTPPEAV